MAGSRGVKKLAKAALEQGWRVEETTKGYMFYPADRSRRPVAVRRQPTDKGLIESLADLRAAGFVWPWPE